MRFRTQVVCAGLACLLLAPASAQAPADQTMFARDRVLDIRIVMKAEDWREVRLSHPAGNASAPAVAADESYLRRPGDLWIDGVRVGQVGVRKKGGYGSVVSTRPSLKLKLDEYVRDQSHAGVNDFTLNNNIQDASFVHQVLAYDFFARAGVPAPRANFARVKVNDEDLGVYTNVEPIGRPFLRRVFGSDSGALYESDTGDFTPDRLSRIVEKRGGRPEDQRKLERLRDLLAADGPVSLPAVEAIVDLNAFMRFWAAETLLGHWDGYSGNRNNYYLYVDPATGLLRFIPWGADQVFIHPSPQIAPLNPPKMLLAVGRLSQRLWELPDVRAKYQGVMRELLAGPWDEPRMLADMAQHQKMLQPMSALTPELVNRVSERVRTFLKSRRTEVLAELAGPAPNWPVSGVAPEIPYTLTGSFTAPWGTQAPANPWLVGTGQLDLQVAGQTIPFDRVAAYAVTNGPPAGRAGYPGIVIIALNGGVRAWQITLTIDPFLFGAGTLPIDESQARAQLSLIEEGKPARNRNRGNRGEIRLEEATAAEGGKLRGTFKIQGIAP